MVDDGDEVVPLDPAGGLHLLFEPAAEFGVVTELLPDELQGHGLPAPCVRQVDGAHPSLADAGEEPVTGGLARILGPERSEDVAVGADGEPPCSSLQKMPEREPTTADGLSNHFL